VTLFQEDTPRALIADLLPDVLVKGGDYSPDQIVGREEVQAVGGEVKVLPFIRGRSTTDLLQAIRGTA
jgi:D-beta-D-heptose 7-phosphate kinase/D-beta-D-heptose 1-phosphate adenosyltransferase